MFNEEDLQALTVPELQELAVLFPINQIVKVLNQKAISNPIIHPLDVKVDDYQTRFEMITKLSEEYQRNKRVFGPGTWFYEIMDNGEAWEKYNKQIKKELQDD